MKDPYQLEVGREEWPALLNALATRKRELHDRVDRARELRCPAWVEAEFVNELYFASRLLDRAERLPTGDTLEEVAAALGIDLS